MNNLDTVVRAVHRPTLTLCHNVCDPLAQNCDDNDGCYAIDGTFLCAEWCTAFYEPFPSFPANIPRHLENVGFCADPA